MGSANGPGSTDAVAAALTTVRYPTLSQSARDAQRPAATDRTTALVSSVDAVCKPAAPVAGHANRCIRQRGRDERVSARTADRFELLARETQLGELDPVLGRARQRAGSDQQHHCTENHAER